MNNSEDKAILIFDNYNIFNFYQISVAQQLTHVTKQYVPCKASILINYGK